MAPMLYRLERATAILFFGSVSNFRGGLKFSEAKRQRAGRTAKVLAGGSSRFYPADVAIAKTRADAKILCDV